MMRPSWSSWRSQAARSAGIKARCRARLLRLKGRVSKALVKSQEDR